MKQLITEGLTTLIEKMLDDILCTSYHNSQNEIRSVVYTVVQRVVLDILQKDGIGETMEDHIVRLFDTVAVADRLWKKLLT